MFCNNCKKEIADNSKFCKYCGVNLENEDNCESGYGCLIAVIVG
ncbi:zinc-ribbon domain-containing protein [bacterium]|nr:zinc-ribbon domain-containing protein [bacterium]